MLAPFVIQSAAGASGVKSQIGMDHRAIVWCNNLLSVVRGVVYTLIQDNEHKNKLSTEERLNGVKRYLGLKDDDDSTTVVSGGEYSTTNYSLALEEHQAKFSVSLHTMHSLCHNGSTVKQLTHHYLFVAYH